MRTRFTLRTSLVALWAMGSVALAFASGSPDKIVVFGDSLSDTGNVAAKFAALPQPVALPAAPYEGGRFTNGPVAVEVMATTLGVSLESYAYGGALTGTDNRITTGGVLTGTGVQSQITDYVASHVVDASALYVLWAGGNDFFSNPTSATVLSASANLAHDVSLLYAAGARDFFIPNLPDLADTADAIAAGGAQQAGAHALTVGFNGALAQTMAQLQGQLAGSTIQVFDTFSTLGTVRAGYAANGGNVTNACWVGNFLGQGTECANPQDYYLWDSVHPTAGVHNSVGLAFAAAVPEPSSYALMMLGLVGVGLAAARQRRVAQGA